MDPSPPLPPNIFTVCDSLFAETNLPNKILQLIFVEKLSFTFGTNKAPQLLLHPEILNKHLSEVDRDMAVKAMLTL